MSAENLTTTRTPGSKRDAGARTSLHAADQAAYRKRNGGSLHRLPSPLSNGCEYSGTLRIDGTVYCLEARVVTGEGGRKHFDLTPYPAARELVRTAKVSGDPSALPTDLVTLMDAPFDDPLPALSTADAQNSKAGSQGKAIANG
jgi:hypothetical protein